MPAIVPPRPGKPTILGYHAVRIKYRITLSSAALCLFITLLSLPAIHRHPGASCWLTLIPGVPGLLLTLLALWLRKTETPVSIPITATDFSDDPGDPPVIH